MTLTVEAWCEALESGDYLQCSEALRSANKFCCLGVACDLSGVGGWSNGEYFVGDEHYAEYLPPVLQRELGIENEEGGFDLESLPQTTRTKLKPFGYYSGTASLVGMNDRGIPFPLIAKVIRARPKGLFREDA